MSFADLMAVAAICAEQVVFLDAVEYLSTRQAELKPLGSLALLVALRMMQPPQVLHISNSATIQVVSFSFSAKRDPRGFRGQDEMRSHSISVQELAAFPEHPCWLSMRGGGSVQRVVLRDVL